MNRMRLVMLLESLFLAVCVIGLLALAGCLIALLISDQLPLMH